MAGPSGVASYSTNPNVNATVDGGNVTWAENQFPSTVNNSVRQNLADIRAAFNDLMWFSYGSGDQDQSGTSYLGVPYIYSSATSVQVAGGDVTAAHHAGRRMRFVGATTGTIFGTIASSTYSSGTNTTTVNLTWDTTGLANEVLTGYLCQIPVTGNPLGGALTGSILGTANQIVATPAAGKVTLSLPSTILVAGPLTFGTSNAQPLIFDINSAEVARFDSAGRLLINATAPFGTTQLLYVRYNANTDSQPLVVQNVNSGSAAATGIGCWNDTGVGALIYTYSSTVANAGLSYRANGALFINTGNGGVTYGNNSAAQPIYFMTGNPGVMVGQFRADGTFLVNPPGGLTFNGIDLLANANQTVAIKVQNQSTGTSAVAAIYLQNNTTNNVFLNLYGTNVASAGMQAPSRCNLYCDGPGGLALSTYSGNYPILFYVNNVEAARFINDAGTGIGELCIGRTAGFQTSGGFSCQASVSAIPVGEFVAVNANPRGQFIYYSTAMNNSLFANGILTMYDSGATRAWFRSDGGLANFQANNLNLSDADLKDHIEPLKRQIVEKLWDAHRDMPWSRYHYKDQTHDDWNWGYLAQDVAKAFKAIAPELVDEFTDDGAFDVEDKTKRIRDPKTIKTVYSEDLHNIAHAVLSDAQRRIEALEAQVKKLETRH